MYNKQNILRYFRQFSEQIPKIENPYNLIVIFGGHKAGKSVTVDLLSGKKMIFSEDIQSGVQTIVQENNWECQYDTMNKNISKNELIIQSLTFESNIQDPTQINKFILLIYLLGQFQRVSFVLVIEQVNLVSLQHQLQKILECLGFCMNINSQNCEIIQQYLNIIVSKSTKNIRKIIEQIGQMTKSNQIKMILEGIMKRQALMLFPFQQPLLDSFGQALKSQIKSMPTQFIKENIENSIYYASKISIHQQQQAQLINFIEKLLIALGSLIAYVKDKQKKYSLEYKKLMNQIFSSHLNKNSIEIMTESINQFTKVKIKDQKQSLYDIMTAMTNILSEFKDKNSNVAKDYSCFLKLIKQFAISMPFIDRNRLLIIYQKMRPFQQLIIQTNDYRDHQILEIPKNVQKNKTTFIFFQQLMLNNCKSNQDAIKFCIESQSNRYINGSYLISYYFIKLLIDLFALFMQSSQSVNFSPQLLQLFIIGENYYYFNIQLDKALQNNYLQIKCLNRLIQRLFPLKKYDECLKIIQYKIQYVAQSSQYQLLNQLKRLIFKVKIQGCNCSKDKKVIDSLQDRKISFTFQSLNQRFGLLRQVLDSDDFVGMIDENNIY